jgi:D-alanyl-D-alanine carboxypeptidase
MRPATAVNDARAALAVTHANSGMPFPAATQAALDAAVAGMLQQFKAPGAVVGVWIPGVGNYVAAAGTSDIATGHPMLSADYFRIGSITKTFTVTAILELADEKRLSLDDPIAKYVSGIPKGEIITLRMLANMTSGLFSYTQDKTFQHDLFSNPHRTFTPRELVNIGIAHDEDFPPGSGFNYSNTNTVLLGTVIEKVTGQPIAEVFAQKIFRPLGLQHTVWPTGSAMPSPFAHGLTDQTLDDTQADATFWNPSWGFSAGQLISTFQDIRTWVKSYTTGSLISPEMQKQRLTWVTFPPNSPDRAYGLGIGMDHGWLGHTGELPGYNCAGYYLPSKGATIVIMVNSDLSVGRENPAPFLVRSITQIVTPQNVTSLNGPVNTM